CPLDGVPLLAAVPSKPPAGVGRVLGSYRLVGLLGEGGMGHIYVGTHTRLRRYAAIKVLKPELQQRRDAIARFFDEANTINRLHHPNIVESLDIVEDDVEGAYCVLELLHGVSLKRRIADGALPVDSARRIGAQIADALHAVHAEGIVHRDLKPDNLILIERDGQRDFVKLIDFGVAQTTDDAAGTPLGTAAYMAPEQADGGRVDGRADVYALGVVLFEMVTGIHPFPSQNDHELVLRHADETPPRPSRVVHDVPKQLETIILRCLEKRPRDRFPTAAAVATALRGVGVPRTRRTGLVLALGAAAALAFGTLAITHDAAPPPRVVAAPPAPPPASSVPRAPATVTLRFLSTPPSAQVFRTGETVPLGTTPFSITLARAERNAALRFELAGHEAADIEASLGVSTEIAVVLDKLPPIPIALDRRDRPRATKSSKPKLQREGVMDPFETTKN
ncbi:MAG TPA: serine/threonine-protein kinase, partial [Kofleriaceae bacterium]|nr:serine/threonine-protein kinase [Kofleriaceae bacterium]